MVPLRPHRGFMAGRTPARPVAPALAVHPNTRRPGVSRPTPRPGPRTSDQHDPLRDFDCVRGRARLALKGVGRGAGGDSDPAGRGLGPRSGGPIPMVELKTISRVTVYADGALEATLLQQFLKMGSTGYTVIGLPGQGRARHRRRPVRQRHPGPDRAAGAARAGREDPPPGRQPAVQEPPPGRLHGDGPGGRRRELLSRTADRPREVSPPPGGRGRRSRRRWSGRWCRSGRRRRPAPCSCGR